MLTQALPNNQPRTVTSRPSRPIRPTQHNLHIISHSTSGIRQAQSHHNKITRLTITRHIHNQTNHQAIRHQPRPTRARFLMLRMHNMQQLHTTTRYNRSKGRHNQNQHNNMYNHINQPTSPRRRKLSTRYTSTRLNFIRPILHRQSHNTTRHTIQQVTSNNIEPYHREPRMIQPLTCAVPLTYFTHK